METKGKIDRVINPEMVRVKYTQTSIYKRMGRCPNIQKHLAE